MANNKKNPEPHKPSSLALEKGLPIDESNEKLVLGVILSHPESYAEVASILKVEDFGTERHRRIYAAINSLFDRLEPIDRVTVYSELKRRREEESIGGIGYLVELDDNIPRILNVAYYCRMVKEKSIARQAIYQAHNLMNLMIMGEGDNKQILAEHLEKIVKLVPSDPKSAPQLPGEIIESYEGGLNAFLQPHLRPQGVMTGYINLDDMTGGLHNGDLTIVCGRPSHGKTAWTMNVMENICRRDKTRCMIFSLEMSKESLVQRMACSVGRIDSMRFRLGYLTSPERYKLAEAVGRISEMSLHIDDSTGVSILDMRAKISQVRAKYGPISMVAVDYLQLMAPGQKGENRNQEISAITRQLKLLAKELDVPMVVLSQLSRATEYRRGNNRPQLSDLRDSGSIEQDADLVLGMFRGELYDQSKDDLRGKAEVIVLKQRNGPIGVAKLAFLKNYSRFENLEDRYEEESPQQKLDYKETSGGKQ